MTPMQIRALVKSVALAAALLALAATNRAETTWNQTAWETCYALPATSTAKAYLLELKYRQNRVHVLCDYRPYSSCRRHHSYGGVCGYPSGESSHFSWRPSGVRSRKVQLLPRASTPRPLVK
jgi:hypothetical protein